MIRYIHILLYLYIIFPAFGIYETFDKSLRMPPSYKHISQVDISILTAEKIMKQGNILGFYKLADEILPKINNNLQAGMWFFYLIAAAPLVDDTVEHNVNWLCATSDLDYQVKENMILLFFPEEFKRSGMIKSNDKLRNMKELFLLYYSKILKQFRDKVNPLLIINYECDKCLYPYNIRYGGIINFNYLKIRVNRNKSLYAIIENMENDFVTLLIRYYPTKSIEVKKYLKLAGYDDREIPRLLDRTIGRVPKAAYLYKGFSKHRN